MNNSSHEHQNKKKTINSQGIYFLGKTERERARPVMSPSTQSSWFSPRMTRKRRAILSLPRWTDSNIHKPTYGFQEPLDKLKKKKKKSRNLSEGDWNWIRMLKAGSKKLLSKGKKNKKQHSILYPRDRGSFPRLYTSVTYIRFYI